MVTVTVDGTETNPTSVTVEVERVVAKIEEMTEDYSFTVKNTTSDVVEFQKVALINGNTKFYPIMKVRGNADNGANDYVEDPNFDNQNETTVADFYSKEFRAETFEDAENEYVKALVSESKATEE